MLSITLPGLPAFWIETQKRTDLYISADLKNHGVWEPVETQVVRDVLRPGDVFVDLGANIGYYTILASLIVGEKGKVFAFEPDPENFRILEANIRRNGLRNVVMEPLAVGDVNGAGRLYLSAENQGDHRIYESKEARESLQVGCTTLDNYFRPLDRSIDVIKMDTQGAEGRILRGMNNLLSQPGPRPTLVMEFWPFGLREAGDCADDVLDILEDLDPEVNRIDEAAGTSTPVSIPRLRELAKTQYHPDTQHFTNLLIKPAAL